MALKLIPLDGARRQVAFHAEISTLSLFRHDGIVRIFDHGSSGATGWYAMELVDGPTLTDFHRALWNVAPTDRISTVLTNSEQVGDSAAGERVPGLGAVPIAAAGRLNRVVRLGIGLCRSLAHLHGRGIVHRDLTPTNVVLRDDDRVVLIDFGLACESPGAHGRESIEMAGLFQGTVSYVAPEQCRGGRVDARADLYALGCVLYELVTGVRPFLGRDPRELIEHHLHTAPVAPSAHVMAVPKDLDALIMRLLAKRPRDRPGSADEVAVALARITGDADAVASWAGDDVVRSEGFCLYAPEFVGREGELAHFDEWLNRLQQKRGARLLVRGETGVGKTFLLGEIAHRARARGLRVTTGASSSPSAASTSVGGEWISDARPFGLLRPMLKACADLARTAGANTIRAVAHAYADVLSTIEPAFVSVSGLAASEMTLSPEAARVRALEAVRALIVTLPVLGPTVLILDDLQWADDLSLQIVRSLGAEDLRDIGLLIVCAVRSDGPKLVLGDDTNSQLLPPLQDFEIRTIVADILGHDPDGQGDELAGLVVPVSNGNPFFASEYLRAAVHDGLLERRRGRWSLSSRGRVEVEAGRARPPPPSLRDIAGRRVRALSAEARSILQLASTLGSECEIDVLLAAAHRDEAATLRALAELEAHAIVTRVSPTIVRIEHQALRDSAYSAMDSDVARATHRAAAEALKSADEERYRFVLGHHFLLAGDETAAFECFAEAGRRALASGFIGEACEQLRRACELQEARPGLLEQGSERVALWRRYGEALAGRGHMDQVERALRVALRHANVRVPVRSVGWFGMLARQMLQHAMLRLAPWVFPPASEDQQATWAEASRSSHWLGFRFMFTTNSVAMIASVTGATNMGERAHTPKLSASPLTVLARMIGLMGMERLASRYFRIARGWAQSSGEVTPVLQAAQSEAFYYYNLGRLDSARDVLFPYMKVAADRGIDYELRAFELIETFVEIARGRFREAEVIARSVAEASTRYGISFYEQQARKLWAICALQLGRFEDALGIIGPLAEEATRRGNEIDRLNLAAMASVVDYRAGRHDVAIDRALALARVAERGSQLYHLFELHTFLPEVLVGGWERDKERPRSTELARSAVRACALARKCARVFRVLAPTAWRLTARACYLGGRRAEGGRALTKARAFGLAYRMPLDIALTALETVRLGGAELRNPEKEVSQARLILEQIGCLWHSAGAGDVSSTIRE